MNTYERAVRSCSDDVQAQCRPSNASASVSSSGALASAGTISTVAVQPISVPQKRYSAFERTLPAIGAATT